MIKLEKETIVFKFGGGCFKDIGSFNHSLQIVEKYRQNRLVIVCSALNGITNKLDNNKKSLITLENELTKISEKIMILNSRENELIELEKKINIELLEINNKSEKISLKIKSLSEKIENNDSDEEQSSNNEENQSW